MICRYCSQEIADGSIFCSFCGERLARKKKGKKEIVKVPEPRQLPSGSWTIQLRKEGVSITEPTREACIERARATRSGYVKVEKAPPKQSLESVLSSYLKENTPVLSPSTVRCYEGIKKNRFQKYMQENVYTINWQQAINEEAKDLKPKTVLNAWRFVTVSLNAQKIPVPDVKLPQLVQDDTPWLDYAQIQTFLTGIKGKSCELPCLLALHSLRISEIRALQQDSIENDIIHVRGAVVPDKNNKYVKKETNKNATSRRDVPVMIPRLSEIWPAEGEPLKLPGLSPMRRMIERVCKDNNLPVITIHGLRHSFASLAYHLGWNIMTTCAVGGWNTPTCVQKIYTHLTITDKNDNVQKMKEFYSGKNTNEITNKK